MKEVWNAIREMTVIDLFECIGFLVSVAVIVFTIWIISIV